MNSKFRLLLVGLFVASIATACGGDGPGAPDFGPGEDGTEEVDGDLDSDPGDDVDAPDILDVNPQDDGQGATDEIGGEVKCQTNADCTNAPIELDPCKRKVCLKPANVCGQDWDPNCCHPFELFTEGFEDGIGKWTVDDPNPLDSVKWSVVENRRSHGKKSIYFGNPKCRTYYNGVLDSNCQPVGGDYVSGTEVRGSVTSPYFSIPPLSVLTTNFVLSLYVWLDTEPFEGSGEVQPDLLKVLILPKGGDSRSEVEIFTSASFNRTSQGNFIHLIANIGEFAGQDVALKFLFDSLDGEDNNFEGVYIDNIQVYSNCDPTCVPGSACEDDGDECTSDTCKGFLNQDTVGVCARSTVRNCLEPVCSPATVEKDCPNTDRCATVKCVQGGCDYDVLPPDQCCLVDEVFAEDFEEGSLGEWHALSYLNNQTVKWQVTSNRAATGTYALYYGNVAARNYASGHIMNFGEITTPDFKLDSRGNYFLSFKLFLSTEFDDVAATEYQNPFGTDFLEIHVVEDAGKETEVEHPIIWSSHYVHGTTGGVFTDIGIDLTEFKGKTIAIRIMFNTGDDQGNDFEGVYIDDFKVTRDTCVRRNCGGDHDCLIDGVCRKGRCADNICSVTVVGTPPDCCANVAQCDDNDKCTADYCTNHQCFHEFIEQPGCCVPTALKEINFDGDNPLAGGEVVDLGTPGAAGVSTKWQVSGQRYNSGTKSLYFGNVDGTYNNGGISKGVYKTATVAIPAYGDFAASFSYWLDVEAVAGRDLFNVEVVVDGTPTKIFSKDDVIATEYKQWRQAGPFSLNAYKGKTISIHFTFDSVDDNDNDGEGVYIDDVLVKKLCP